MEPLPLVPKLTTLSNHDTTHILREAFQDFFSAQTFPKNIANNVEKYNLKMIALKENGMHANNYQQSITTYLEDVTRTEEKLLQRHAEYFIAKDSIINDPPVNEKNKLKRMPIAIRELSAATRQKHGLLDIHHLLPPLPERVLDFTINLNQHLCESCETEPEIHPVTSQKKSRSPTFTRKSGSSRKLVYFEPSPKEILFDNYELNVTYVKKIKLRNVTKTIRSVVLKHLPKMKYFTVFLESSSRIAAGMCAVYCVKYKTDVYHDIEADEMTFSTFGGKTVTVQLRSKRMAPCLRVFIFRTKTVITNTLKLDSLSDEYFDMERTIALNTSIDCGSSLIGDEVVLSIIMKNEGGTGKFFLLTETDWFDSAVQHISHHIELIAGSFRLYPAFFVINENEFVEVVLSFYPKRYGLFVETVYMLCNNNTFEELDLVGDGVYFEKSYITFDLKKKDCKPFFLDHQSEYCLHLGKCLSCTEHAGFIRVTNNSPLNLCYRWMLRRSENSKSKDFKHMAPHWITIKRMVTLPACSTTDFDIIFHPETATSGLYRIVLSLYVEDIPEISLRDLEEFTVLERNDCDDGKNKLVDVLMGEIELLCEVEEIDVVIEPNPLNVPFQLSSNSDSYCEQIITVTSNTSFPLMCEWFAHTHNRKVEIAPTSFELKDSMQCKLLVTRTDIDNVDEEFLLYVKDGALKIHFIIQANVIIPRGILSIATIDFGHVMENFVYNRSFLVQNTSRDTVQWKIAEDIVLLQEDPTVVGTAFSECVVPNHGTLHQGESCNVEYTANTRNCGEWLSYLKLYTNYAKHEQADFVCGVHFIVCKPEGVLHTDTSEMPILCPEDVLYVDVPVDSKICLHNSGNIVLIYAFGKPTGVSASHFDIQITPNIGIIKVRENCRIDVKITANAMGYFEDVYIPIFILGCDKVKLVKLMCLVSDIIVTIFLPDDKEDYKAVVWPQIVPEPVEEVKMSEEGDTCIYKFQDYNSTDVGVNDSCEECTSSRTTTAYTRGSSAVIGDEIIEIKPPPYEQQFEDEEQFNDIDKFMTLFDVTASGGGNFAKLTASQDAIHNSDYITEDTSTTTTTTTTTSNVTRSSSSGNVNIVEKTSSLKSTFKKFFGPELVVQTDWIEFAAVPLRTPVKKTIKIVNMTPGSGIINVEVLHFYASDQPKNKLNELLAEMKMAKSTLWDDQIADNGIVIKTDQVGNVIGNRGQMEIDVWVYANTWGLYLDEIVIDISGLTPFCASLLVEVIGSPITIPMAQNSIRQEPTIRFGTVPYKSKKVTRRLKVINTSVVPLTISWHMFVNLHGARKAFSLLFDMPDTELLQFSEELVKGHLFLTNKYFGEPNTCHFEIEPLLSYIEPQSYGYVEITAMIDKFGGDLVGKQIEANLAGLIRVPTRHMHGSNILTRPADVNLPITRVRLTLQIVASNIEIDDSIKTIDIIAFAANIMEKESFSFQETLVLRNNNTYPTSVYVETEKPFRICEVKTPTLLLTQPNTCIELLPRECMQLTIEASFLSEDILKLVETIRTAKDVATLRPNFEENSMTISRLLNIYQNGHLHKIIPLDMKIFYPLFRVFPASIKFDNVYIGDTAKTIVILKNLTGPQLRYEIYKCYRIKQFYIKPDIGIIPSTSNGGTHYLNVFFTPSEPKTYEEWIAITTHIPHHYVIVNVAGTGTYDEKFHIPGLH